MSYRKCRVAQVYIRNIEESPPIAPTAEKSEKSPSALLPADNDLYDFYENLALLHLLPKKKEKPHPVTPAAPAVKKEDEPLSVVPAARLAVPDEKSDDNDGYPLYSDEDDVHEFYVKYLRTLIHDWDVLIKWLQKENAELRKLILENQFKDILLPKLRNR
ncbi:964_t:CDS:2 [Gigaspora rosea]|nr:964_t:CDS:2 [Gigaspora rosea]